MFQLVRKLDLADTALFKDEIALLQRLANDRAGVIKDLNMQPEEGKESLLAAVAGKNIRESKHPIIIMSQRLGRMLRWLAASCLPDVLSEIRQNPDKWALASCFAAWWQKV